MNERHAARRFLVSGTVQGVGYRYFTQRAAERLEIAGFVRNRRDGRVEVYAIGPEESLAALRRELERGPAASAVSSIAESVAPLDPDFSAGFSIEYDT